MRALANDDVSLLVGKFWNGSHKSRENGSKMLLLRPVPNTLGMIDIIVVVIVTVKCCLLLMSLLMRKWCVFENIYRG